MEGEHLDRLAEDIATNGLHDPTAFVLSANVHRRNLSTGQRAMAVAMLSPEPEQGKRTDLTINGEVRISQQRIADARAVLLGGVNRARTMLAFANRCHSRTT